MCFLISFFFLSILQHKDEFLFIISATKGNPSEKRLASQFIARFFKYFPEQAGEAINALFDLCEDDDSAVWFAQIKLTMFIIANPFRGVW